MGRLVKIHNGEVLVVVNYVATPTYTLRTADYAAGATPPHGWEYHADNVVVEDFAAPWVQPTGSTDAYANDAVVAYNGKKWRSTILGNVWTPGISGWADVTTDTPAWIQPTGAHDAYTKDAVVQYSSKLWKSLSDANVWAPGVAQWREVHMTAPGDPVLVEWVQPTGAGDAYTLGAQVLHLGFTWTSTVAANVWEPGVYGWDKV